jgi:hypothetical protein
MDALTMSLVLQALLETDQLLVDEREGEPVVVENVRTFETANVERHNDGLVVDLSDGTQYRITVVRSR